MAVPTRCSEWSTDNEQHLQDATGAQRVVTLESADLRIGDHVYPEQCFRVLIDGRTVTRTKGYRLTGESAWCNAERLFDDVCVALRYKGTWR